MSPIIADVFVGIVAFVQVAIMFAEMLLWKREFHKRLGFTDAEAESVAPIVANAGLYNGFLAAGLFWGIFSSVASVSIKTFFLLCVIVAGLFGAVTLKWTTLVIQTGPATVALLLVWMSRT